MQPDKAFRVFEDDATSKRRGTLKEEVWQLARIRWSFRRGVRHRLSGRQAPEPDRSRRGILRMHSLCPVPKVNVARRVLQVGAPLKVDDSLPGWSVCPTRHIDRTSILGPDDARHTISVAHARIRMGAVIHIARWRERMTSPQNCVREIQRAKENCRRAAAIIVKWTSRNCATCHPKPS